MDGQIKRKKKYATSVRTLWYEQDGRPFPEDAGVEPTALVESSPGHYHGYVRMKRSVNPRRAEAPNKALGARLGGDASGYDLTQLLRVPGTPNHKYPERPVVKIVKLDATLEHDPTELAKRLQPESAEEKPAEDPLEAEEFHYAHATEPPVRLGAAAMARWNGEVFERKADGTLDRSYSLVQLGRALAWAGATEETVASALASRDVQLRWGKYAEREDHGATNYRKIARKACADAAVALGEPKEEPLREEPEEAASQEPEAMEWMELDHSALRGLFGDIVWTTLPHTEGHKVGILASTLGMFGNMIGRGAYMRVSAVRHHTNLYFGLVGETSHSRKGSATAPAQLLMGAVDSEWSEGGGDASGLSSGEGVVYRLRDPLTGPDGKVLDPGVSDKRLMVVEEELAHALKVLKREGNTLSTVLRRAWDGKNLSTLTRNNPLRATKPHLSILGHITREELLVHLTELEVAAGLGNRFLWLLVKRSKSLPRGGRWHDVDVAKLTKKSKAAADFARNAGELTWAEDGGELWDEVYEGFAELPPSSPPCYRDPARYAGTGSFL